MNRMLQQIVPTCEGWEAVFFSYDDGELFREAIVCWGFLSERPYVGRNVPRPWILGERHNMNSKIPHRETPPRGRGASQWRR